MLTRRDENACYNYSCGEITLGQLITKARGGDLILVQDMAYVDNYTLMNSQEAHYMKHFLRFKCKESPQRVVAQWSRLALVVDSDIPDVKHLIEVTEKGVDQYDFLQRMMDYKKDKQRLIAWMRCLQPINEQQKDTMLRIA